MQNKSLKRIYAVLFVFLSVLCLKSPVFAQLAPCSTGTWTQTSTDTRGQTRYTLSAPCVVNLGEPFTIIATASDETWPNTRVGGSWSIQDNGITLAAGGILTGIVTNETGSWVSKPTQTYDSPGEHTISFTYRDYGNGEGGMNWDPVVILSGTTVAAGAPNTAPECNVVSPTAGQYPSGQEMPLVAEVVDNEGDILRYMWTDFTSYLHDGEVDTEPNIVSRVSYTYPPYGLSSGEHIVTFEAWEKEHPTQRCSVSVNITVYEDTNAPEMNPMPSQSLLWPPNGEMTTVTIDANATDNSGGPVMLNAMVTSNEPSQTDKDGNVIPDFVITNIDQTTGVITSQLRAQRTGNGGDRLYSVTVQATDQSGNSSKHEVVIKAPHDNGRR